MGSGATPWTYARSGVDLDRRGAALANLLREVRYRPPPTSGRRVALPGHYAGLVRVGRETLAITTDTVGTKVLIAEELGRWEEVGEDIVGVNVNDLASVGARPIGLVDVLSVVVPDPTAMTGVGRGLDRGLARARCHLLGGETAVVPELVRGTDLGGCAIGYFPRGRTPVTGEKIRPGDELIGLGASGAHANGFTLIRRLLKERSIDLRSVRPQGDRPIGEELLAPTRIYSPASEACAGVEGIVGLAHVSGGGVRNLVRLRERVEFVLDAWPEPPALFRYLQGLGEVPEAEMFQTFNMGIGFIVVSRPHRIAELLRRLRRAGYPDARRVGHVARGRGVSVPAFGVRFEGYA